MDRAALLLARSWQRAWRGWWWASTASLAAILVLVVGTAGLLDGLRQETTATVADFYTGGARVTAEGSGAAPDARFPFNTTADLDQAKAGLERAAGAGSSAIPRLETTAILSRRTLLEAYLTEQDQYGVDVPGTEAGRDAYRVGLLNGLPMDEPAATGMLRPYLVTGRMPVAASGNGTIEILLSQRQFKGLLDPDERAALHDPPTDADLAGLRLEVTAAHLVPGTRDLLRARAIVVGLFSSGVETLDRATVLAPIQDVRRLVAAEPDGPAANAFVVVGGDAGAAAAEARRQGWSAESPEAFTHRYLGQLVDFLEAVALAVSALLLAVPFLLVWMGLSQQLDRSRRELAVGKAIGLPPSSVRLSLGVLAMRVVVVAVAVAAVVVTLLGLAVQAWGPERGRFPLPLGFHVPLWIPLATAALLALATVAAVWGALRRHRTMPLSSTLRAL
jgi:hypothetical protein